VIRKLLATAAFPHAVRDLRVVETHISWVILTGDFAYKIKKPVVLGFLDFSTLERRKHYCEEELRINRRTTPELYLGVVPIGDTPDGLRIGAEPALEYAVLMRQFPHQSRLDRRLQTGLLEPVCMRDLAVTIADFHHNLPPLVNVVSGIEADRAVKPARNNFRHLDPGIFSDESQQQLAVIEAWTLQQAEALGPVFEARARGGFIRECHGDLHLENLLWRDGRYILFDGIEFNPDLRWIDTANDIAFLAMDLMARQRGDLAFALLNAWLEETGDYESLAIMRYYLVYRSMVRAVVTSIRQQQQPGGGKASFRLPASRYIELAADLVDTPPPRLYLMHGFAGSGKTWSSEKLVCRLPALRVRSDLERKRLPGVPAEEAGAGGIESGLYSPEITDRTYQALARCCEAGLRAGIDMIADATFLRRSHRERFFALAARVGVEITIVDCVAPEHILRDRIRRRAREGQDASDADLAVLEYQLSHRDELSACERVSAVSFDSGFG